MDPECTGSSAACVPDAYLCASRCAAVTITSLGEHACKETGVKAALLGNQGAAMRMQSPFTYCDVAV